MIPNFIWIGVVALFFRCQMYTLRQRFQKLLTIKKGQILSAENQRIG